MLYKVKKKMLVFTVLWRVQDTLKKGVCKVECPISYIGINPPPCSKT